MTKEQITQKVKEILSKDQRFKSVEINFTDKEKNGKEKNTAQDDSHKRDNPRGGDAFRARVQ